MEDQFSRTRMLFGPQAISVLGQARVAVFGIGGVGGHVVEVLARSGVGALTLVDGDVVDVTNLNRQLVALHSTLGQPKVEVAARRVRDINPACKVEPLRQFYLPQNADSIDLRLFSYVIDCVDTMTAKLELIKQCHRLGVPLICAMGAGNKVDPTAFRVADINDTSMDPLAKVIRKKLRKLGIPRQKVVYSPEQPLQPFGEEAVAEAVAESGGFRRRSFPASNAFVPAAEGLVIGGEVVKDLLKFAGAFPSQHP